MTGFWLKQNNKFYGPYAQFSEAKNQLVKTSEAIIYHGTLKYIEPDNTVDYSTLDTIYSSGPF